MNKKTYERCYICDRPGDNVAPSGLYNESTTYIDTQITQVDTDDRPICRACLGSAMDATNELENGSGGDAWKAEDLGWLFGEVREEEVEATRSPEAAREALERLQDEWRHEDRAKEKARVGASYEDLDHV